MRYPNARCPKWHVLKRLRNSYRYNYLVYRCWIGKYWLFLLHCSSQWWSCTHLTCKSSRHHRSVEADQLGLYCLVWCAWISFQEYHGWCCPNRIQWVHYHLKRESAHTIGVIYSLFLGFGISIGAELYHQITGLTVSFLDMTITKEIADEIGGWCKWLSMFINTRLAKLVSSHSFRLVV